jgi:hypothetical protein
MQNILQSHTQHHWLCSTYSAICVLSLVLKARAILLNHIMSGLFAVCSSWFIQIMSCKARDEVLAHRHCIFCFYLVGPSLAVYTASFIVLHSSSPLLWFSSSRGSSVISWNFFFGLWKWKLLPFSWYFKSWICTMYYGYIHSKEWLVLYYLQLFVQIVWDIELK